MKIVLSTRNKEKERQIKAVLTDLPISIINLDEAGIEGQGIEDGTTLEENALKKAMFVREKKSGIWAMADDTGIFIDALNGKPGVHTADWLGGKLDSETKMHLILQELERITDRSATFKTVVALVSPEGTHYLFEGEVKGILLSNYHVKPQPQMPYSAIFKPDGCDKVFAEMSVDEENNISHRGKAFRQVRKFLDSHQVAD